MSSSSERKSPGLRPAGSSGGHSDWSLSVATQSSQLQDELSELMSSSSERKSPELRPAGSSGGHSDWSLPLVTQSSQSQDELSELRMVRFGSASLLFKYTTLLTAYEYTQWEQAVPISTKLRRPDWTVHPTLKGDLLQRVKASLYKPQGMHSVAECLADERLT